MRVTNPLLLKSLISKIHPQLPLNARESDQLLNILKTSFRKHLDVVHPTEEQRTTNTISSTSMPKAASSHLSTTRHIDNILTNPLFAIKPRNSTFGTSGAKTGGRVTSERRLTLEELTNQFQDRLASGLVTQEVAAQYLKEVFQTARRMNAQDIKKNIITARSGSLVFKWLQSTGLSHSLQVIQDMQFTANLTAHLVLENQHFELRDWILPSLTVSEDVESTWKRHVITNYINTSIAQKDHPDVVVDRYCELLASFKKSFPTYPRNKIRLFNSAGNRLGLHLTSTKGGHVSADAFYRFWNAYLPHADTQNVLHALLPLHAPGSADASTAVKHLRKYASGQWQLPGAGLDQAATIIRKTLSTMCLDAANILIDKKNYKDASWVLSYARTEFATELGIQQTHVSKTSAPRLPSKVLERRYGSLAFG